MRALGASAFGSVASAVRALVHISGNPKRMRILFADLVATMVDFTTRNPMYICNNALLSSLFAAACDQTTRVFGA